MISFRYSPLISSAKHATHVCFGVCSVVDLAFRICSRNNNTQSCTIKKLAFNIYRCNNVFLLPFKKVSKYLEQQNVIQVKIFPIMKTCWGHLDELFMITVNLFQNVPRVLSGEYQGEIIGDTETSVEWGHNRGHHE